MKSRLNDVNICCLAFCVDVIKSSPCASSSPLQRPPPLMCHLGWMPATKTPQRRATHPGSSLAWLWRSASPSCLSSTRSGVTFPRGASWQNSHTCSSFFFYLNVVSLITSPCATSHFRANQSLVQQRPYHRHVGPGYSRCRYTPRWHIYTLLHLPVFAWVTHRKESEVFLPSCDSACDIFPLA